MSVRVSNGLQSRCDQNEKSKMIVPNFLFDVISLTNLTILFNRLIDEGQYKSVYLWHDEELIRKTNFVEELSSSTSRTMTIADINTVNSDAKPPIDRHQANISNTLQMYVIYGKPKSPFVLRAERLDTIYLFPMNENERNDANINHLLRVFFYARRERGLKCTVIFYDSPKTSKGTCNTIVVCPIHQPDLNYNCFLWSNSTTDVRRTVVEQKDKTLLLLTLFNGILEFRNSTNINFRMADDVSIFMANYIARNTKSNVATAHFLNKKDYEPSNGTVYAELSISFPEKLKMYERYYDVK